MTSERGQATIEWTAVMLLVALVLSAAAAFVPVVDGRSFGSFLAHAIVCAIRGGCDDGDRALAAADGRVVVRATSHDGYQSCKQKQCHNKWTRITGWTRVSKGSHAGHIPLEPLYVRDGHVQLAPDLSLMRPYGYRPLYPGIDLHERT